MSYVTVEVEIADGKVVPKEPEKLPAHGTGFLTILAAAPARQALMAPLEAFRTLQGELRLTPEKAQAWQAGIRDARR